MVTIVWAKVIFKDTCDPGLPGDCAPLIQIEQAAAMEKQVSDHGIMFDELIQDQESFSDPTENEWEDIAEDEELWAGPVEDVKSFEDVVEDVELPEQGEDPECPLEPDRPWEESVCGELERRLLSRILGG